LIIFIVFLGIILVAGCTQQTKTPQPVPSTRETTTAGTSVPVNAITSPASTRPPVSLDKTIKDSELDFALSVPSTWNGTTIRSINAEGFEGLGYLTNFSRDAGKPVSDSSEEFTILTYAITRGQDQSFRTDLRENWIPQPAESTVTVNNIVFDRFETSSNGITAVAYVVRKASANEKGFASVIFFKVRDAGSTYSAETFDAVAQSFRYLTQKEVASLPGEEAAKVL
jgi:hypothetical protein